MSFPPKIEGGKEILEFSEAGGNGKFSEAVEKFLGEDQIFVDQLGGGTQNCDTKIILKMILIQM